MQFVITLVHGTFARDARWTRDGSNLRTALANMLGAAGNEIAFRPFSWNGRNSFRARSGAALDLRSFLEERLAEFPDATHAIVAHSHGGNIVLYALRAKALAARIDSVVLLSTPFFATQERDFGDWSDLLVAGSCILLSVIPAVVLMGIIGSFVDTNLPWLANNRIFETLLFFFTGFVAWFIWSLLRKLGRLWFQRAKDWASHVNATEPDSDTRVLVIRPIADEASAVLTALYAPSILMVGAWRGFAWLAIRPLVIAAWAEKFWLSRWVVALIFWGLFLRFWASMEPSHARTIAWAYGFLACTNLLGAIFYEDFGIVKLVLFLLTPVFLLSGVMFLMLFFLLSLFALPLNLSVRDFPSFVKIAIFLGPFDVSVEHTPAGDRYRPDRIPEDAKSCFRHSSTYDNPTAIQKIVAWIAAAKGAGEQGRAVPVNDQTA